KNSLNGMKKLFAPDEKQIIEQMRKCRDDVAALIDITRVFKARFDEMKHIRGLIDFNDMEHDCLKILKENPSIADEYRAFFKEIYVDEYQDSNLVQETIVNAIADHNVFNVGDVKQSIYRFRMARPELFLQKYQTYGKGKAGLRIDLHDNFRSRIEVINAVNEVFGRIMRKEIGGIDYDDDAALKYGATYYDEIEEDNKITDDINTDRNAPENNEKTTQSVDKMPVTNADYENITGDPEPVNSIDPCGHNPYVAEYVGIMKNEETDPKELEAAYIARRISDLISSGLPVYDKQLKELRPIRYSDIVILLRATRGWDDVFCRVIGGYGIPIHATSVTGYFSAREIVWLLSYLQVIDNPLQDIPLAAVLRSPIGKVNDTELAMIRAEHKKMPLYQNLCDFASKTTNEVNTPVIEKVRDFLARLEDLRVRSAYTSVYEILQEIVDGDYGRAILSSPGGERGYANLNMLLSHALEFGKTSYRGLFQFVRYIECLKKNEIDYGEAGLAGENENVVRLMSIHKSKGLEFPVVFLSGMHKNLNFRDAYDSLVQDADLGIGIALIDSERRTRQATLSKNVISRKILCDNLAEEIRVLYVGMTRAREKLIMTGIAKKEDYVLGGCPVLAKADSYRALLD
ncbi:MAG: UvrD-helicase domain-containing protein, partial [Lachnospiraceae bacterium]|nr:UvrD-helicase domain-containing protein [Lachnospiraceae bacterium]